MDEREQGGTKIRFGIFELDTLSGELLKGGTRVRLQEQPFQVLSALVERPGEVVSREDLQQRLWPDETFVDFEDGLSTAVRKIRQALGDSASNPRFIETLPKRGYRFIAPVDVSGEVREGQARSRPRRSLLVPYGLAGAAAVVVLIGMLWTIDSVESPPIARSWSPIPLTSYPGEERTPDFSPDGNQVVFAWSGEDDSDLDVYVKTVGLGEPVRLTTDSGDDFAPVWSPDGQWIAFSRHAVPSRRADLIVMPALGGRERKILDYPLNSDLLWRYAAWTPDSGSLIINVGDSESHEFSGLTVVSVETGERRQLTSPKDSLKSPARDLLPAVSPDGRWVAFCRFTGSGSIHKVRLTPGGPTDEIEITKGTTFLTIAPTWSPDGSDVIFYRSFGPATAITPGLWRVSASGDYPPTPMNLNGIHPVGSPAANRLAYQSIQRDRNIWRIPLAAPGKASGEPQPLLNSTREETFPNYSPDGSKIAFRSNRSGTIEIWVANSDGSNAAPLTNMAGGATGTPRWSPDGKQVLFNSMAAGNREAYVIDAEGGPVRRVTNHPADESMPSWSADGRSIYFTSNRSGTDEVWTMPVDGGEATQVTHGGGGGAYESSDGTTLYFVRENTLYKMHPPTGPESMVLPGVRTHHWNLLDYGFYYVPIERTSEIRYFDFASGEHNLVIELPFGAGQPWASPDGQGVAFVAYEPSDSDLMLVENFE